MATSARPLVVTADGALLDEVLGVACAAGVAVDVAVDLSSARPQWTHAPLVLLGSDVVSSGVEVEPRSGVIVVGVGSPPPVTGFGPGDLVGLPGGEARLMALLAETLEPDLAATTVAVVSGRGGAGASTLAAALALAAAREGNASWLVDLDPLGGGADCVLGAELAAGVRWSDLSGTAGRLSARALRDAVPTAAGVSIVSCDSRAADGPEPAIVRSVLDAAGRGGGIVVLDLPRQSTPAREQALTVVDRMVVVVPAEVRAVLAARRLMIGLEAAAAKTDVVVRRVGGGLPPAEVCRAVGLPLAGVLDDEPSVRAAGLTGSVEGILRSGAIAHLCGELLSALRVPNGAAA